MSISLLYSRACDHQDQLTEAMQAGLHAAALMISVNTSAVQTLVWWRGVRACHNPCKLLSCLQGASEAVPARQQQVHSKMGTRDLFRPVHHHAPLQTRGVGQFHQVHHCTDTGAPANFQADQHSADQQVISRPLVCSLDRNVCMFPISRLLRAPPRAQGTL